MARVLFFVILAVCLFYVVQASPMPNDGAQPATGQVDAALAQLGEAIKNAWDNGQKNLEVVLNDPTVKQLGEDGKQMLQRGAQTLHEFAQSIINQTH